MADHSPEASWTSIQEAKDALALLVKFFEERQDVYDAEQHPIEGDPDHWNKAKQYATAILEASGRDDWCGCPLCRS